MKVPDLAARLAALLMKAGPSTASLLWSPLSLYTRNPILAASFLRTSAWVRLITSEQEDRGSRLFLNNSLARVKTV